MYCTVLYCTVPYCDVLYSAVQYCTVMHCYTALYCNTVLYCDALYRTVLYCDVLYLSPRLDGLRVRLVLRLIILNYFLMSWSHFLRENIRFCDKWPSISVKFIRNSGVFSCNSWRPLIKRMRYMWFFDRFFCIFQCPPHFSYTRQFCDEQSKILANHQQLQQQICVICKPRSGLQIILFP